MIIKNGWKESVHAIKLTQHVCEREREATHFYGFRLKCHKMQPVQRVGKKLIVMPKFETENSN